MSLEKGALHYKLNQEGTEYELMESHLKFFANKTINGLCLSKDLKTMAVAWDNYYWGVFKFNRVREKYELMDE